MTDDLRAAVAAGVLGSEEAYLSLLTSIAEVARAIFAPAPRRSSSSTRRPTSRLAAPSGRADRLVGALSVEHRNRRLVLVTRQPLVLEDVSEDPRFARDAAGGHGVRPRSLMAVPLLHEERVLGVLEVLDRPQRPGFTLEQADLLGLFANQAAIALDLLLAARRAKAVLAEEDHEAEVVVAASPPPSTGSRASAERALRLLAGLEEILRTT